MSEQTLQEGLVWARNEARRIVAVGLADVIEWTGAKVSPMEGPLATGDEWRRYLHWMHPDSWVEHCRHPRDLLVDGVCLVCGFCMHRRVLRIDVGTSYEVQACEMCGEERYPGRGRSSF